MNLLTDDQAKEVAQKLLANGGNVYRRVESILGRPLDDPEIDAVYEQVEKAGGIFKCNECNGWFEVTDRCSWRDDACVECEPE